MRTYSGEIQRTDEYKIIIDESVWNDEALESWNSVFGGCEDLQDLARHLAEQIMRLGSDYGFIEGFGYIKTIRANGSEVNHFEGFELVDKERYCKGIELHIISEDDDYWNRIEEQSQS